MVYYNYPASGVGAALGRLGDIADGNQSGRTRYASYMFLGAGTMVDANYPAVTGTLALTYAGTASGDYPGFDRFGRVVDQKWQNQSAGTVKDQFKYGYDRTSNRLYRTNELNHDLDELYHANGPSGAYDGLDRLTGFRRGALTDTDSDGVLDTVADNSTSRRQEWTLDPVGNWSGFKSSGATTQPWDLDQARLHNKANEIEDTGQTPNAISGTPDWIDPAYDLAGNMTKGPQPRYETVDANTQWYKYDAWNRLTRLGQGASSPGTLVATYSYDGQNRRIRKVVEAGESDITYDYYYNESWQVLEVRKAIRTNKTYQQFVWGIQYVDAPVVQFRDTADDGTLDQALYATYDGNFNVTALVGTDGTVAERYTYDPYGQVTFKAANWSDAASQAKSAYDNEILYCGYRFDPESGNYQVRNRYLTPPLGRWLTTDPIGYGDGMNLYEYCGGAPGIHTDPTGQATMTVNVLPGWYKQNTGKKALGQARWCFKIPAKCVCPKGTTVWKIPTANVDVTLAITLNPDAPTPHTKEGVYGHELRHIDMMQKALETHRREIELGLLTAENTTFNSKKACNQFRSQLRNDFKAKIGAIASSPAPGKPEDGFWHRATGSNDNGHPVQGEEYPNHPGDPAGESKGDGVPLEKKGGWICNPVYKD